MFNQIFKERFINETDYSDGTKRAIETEFVNVEYYENLLNKDLANFSKKEISDYYKLKDTTSLGTLTTINSYFIQYTAFAIRNNFVNDGINHFAEFDSNELMNCLNSGKKKNRYVTRDELMIIIEDPELDLPNREKVILLALFEGIFGVDYDELYDLDYLCATKDGDNYLIKSHNRDASISTQLFSYIEMACKEYEYQVDNGKGWRTIRLDPEDTSALKVMKRKDSNTDKINLIKRRTIAKMLYKISTKAEVPFTATTLYESGRMDYIKSLRKEDEPIYDCIYRNMDLIAAKYNTIKNITRYLAEFGDYF